MTIARLVGVSISVVFVACASAAIPPAPTLTPSEFESGTDPLTFARLVIRVPAGAEIGRHHSGMLRVKRDRYRWESGIFIASDEFKVIASETMRDYGITVLGGDNLLFGRDESAKATYQLGGTLTDLRYNTFGGLAGNYVDAWVQIEWQVYHALREAVVFTHTTRGSARHSDWRTGVNAVKEAFRAALKNLIAEEEFASLVNGTARVTADEPVTGSQVSAFRACRSPAATRLPRDAEATFTATPVIRVGGTLGSSVIMSPDGYALTAAHVVSEVEQATVRFHSGLELTAQVVAIDREQDIALLKLPGSGYACLPLADHVGLVGSELFAIGNPYEEELAFTVTRGVVSGHRQYRGFAYIQTDASLNPGNSGGPMLNENGEVIGIVSFKLIGLGVEGIAFGVPPEAIVERLRLTFRN